MRAIKAHPPTKPEHTDVVLNLIRQLEERRQTNLQKLIIAMTEEKDPHHVGVPFNYGYLRMAPLSHDQD